MPMGLPSSLKQLPYDYPVITPFLTRFCSTQWNKIEHRMFCHITQNWRGRPLTDRLAIVELIGAPTTKTGLKVECSLDTRIYEKGIKISDAEMATLNITGDAFHPEWNYTIRPRRTGNS
jgi:Rhodopirellula transposase DDE domain